MNPSILFENKHLLIVNKPSGLVVHSDGKTIEPTLCDWIVEHYPNIKGVGEPSRTPTGLMVDRPGIVHRLDRETSGALLVAKTQEAFEFLKKQFKDRNIHKIYNVFVWGLVKEDKGTISRPIGRSKTDFRRWSAERFARGELRDAITEYKVLKRHDSDENPNLNQKTTKHEIPKRFSFLEVFPKTGRTHQIRVHFKAINHPVVGDKLYAPNHPEVLGFNRVALHARRVEFEDMDGKKIDIEAPLPKDFEEALNGFTN
jgi:23S rRNA pseudouridine1911/1915/1917 synthase